MSETIDKLCKHLDSLGIRYKRSGNSVEAGGYLDLSSTPTASSQSRPNR